MDEAGSSVDAETDELMQRVLQEAFKTCTTIAIVHKLHTVLDFDRAVVLEKGRLFVRLGSSFKVIVGCCVPLLGWSQMERQIRAPCSNACKPREL